MTECGPVIGTTIAGSISRFAEIVFRHYFHDILHGRNDTADTTIYSQSP